MSIDLEMFMLKTRCSVVTNVNTLLFIQKIMQTKSPNHELLELVTSTLEESEEMLSGVMEMSAELRLSRQRNFDLESLVSKLQNDLDIEKKLSKNLMEGL